MSFGKASRSSRASTYSSNSGYRVDPDSIRGNCQERATWNSAGISLLDFFTGFTEPVARPSHGRLMGSRVDFWRKTSLSRKTVQRYGEHLPFSKYFRKKNEKKCILWDLRQENDDLLEWIRNSDYSGNRDYRARRGDVGE